jgi:hypothetical protein
MARDEQDEPGPTPPPALDQISTSWRSLNDPTKFVMSYGAAIRKYLLALLRDEHEADEALQDLLLQVTAQGFPHARPDRGRFRDYLKAVVRNAARARLRQKQRAAAGDEVLEQVADDRSSAEEQAWLAEWRQCVLNKAWRGLERHQHGAPGNLFYTVLRLTADHPGQDSRQLAARASQQSGQALSPAAFRKQLSRSRRRFAELIVDEVRQTLEAPTPEQVREELAELYLLEYLRDFLPEVG